MEQDEVQARLASESVLPTSSSPETETWIPSMMLSPRENEKLVLYQIADIARRRMDRGTKLNFPEAIAVICETLLESARDGASLNDTIETGKRVLTRNDVLPGVPEMVSLVQVEATFKTGTQLVSVTSPIS